MPNAQKRSRPQGSPNSSGVKKTIRVPRACDNCRLRKSKCDGALPCSFCSLHSSECTYDNSRPKKQLDTKYIVLLERTIDRLKEIIGIPVEVEVTTEYLDSYEPNVSQTGEDFDAPHPRPKHHVATQTSSPAIPGSPVARTLLESMVEATGRLNIDESGNYDYSGNSAGLTLVERIRERCDFLLERKNGHEFSMPRRTHSFPLTSPQAQSPARRKPRALSGLPPWEIAAKYIHTAFDEAFSLFNFIHRPSFDSRLHVFYAARSAGLESNLEDQRFETFLYALFALGELFGAGDYALPDGAHGKAARAEAFFYTATQTIDLVDCRDITSLQALLCICIYLQGSGQLPACYSYISIATTAGIRMGLHREDSLAKFNPIERETRKRVFWALRGMDSYVTTNLDLPRNLRDEDTDQSFPLELDDVLITTQKVKAGPKQMLYPMTTVNAHTKLAQVLSKARFTVLDSSREGENLKPNGRYQVDYAKIVEVEQELAEWSSQLSEQNNLAESISTGMEKSQLLLRIAQGHVSMVLYRPFLHHLSRRNTEPNFDFRGFACASACIKSAMQVIWLVEALDGGGQLRGPSWFLFFTLFVAIVSSMMFVISNKEDVSANDYYAAALRGFRILEKFALSNQSARNYTESLRPLFLDTPALRKGSDSENDMMITPPDGLRRSLQNHAMRSPAGADFRSSQNASIKSPGVQTMRHSGSSDFFLPDAMVAGGLDPSMSIAPTDMEHINDTRAQQIYLQAMNCTPTNFFEGFSSETAMMDYFTWHEQDPGASGGMDAGPSGSGGFGF